MSEADYARDAQGTDDPEPGGEGTVCADRAGRTS